MLFHVVANDENHHALWPDFRRDALPAGWRFTGFSGARAACLEKILADHRAAAESARAGASASARGAATIAKTPAAAAQPAARTTGQTSAVPFPRATAASRLFVFPHAGSGASYYHFLARAFKDDAIEVHIVQYPGREMRIKEPPLAHMEAMIDMLCGDIAAHLSEKPAAFLGHSMGALTAFELTRRLRAAGSPLPRHLFLSGRHAPQLPGHGLKVESLDDGAFLDAVGRRYNALPPELLAHREILELVLPSLRADFLLMERHVHREEPPLGIGLTLLNGADDPWVTATTLEGWRAQSTYPLQQHVFPGGHFYLPTAAGEIRAVVLQTLGIAR